MGAWMMKKYKSIYMSVITNLHVHQFNLDSYRESKENAGVFVTHELLHTATLTSRDTVWNCQSIKQCDSHIVIEYFNTLKLNDYVTIVHF